MKFVFYLAPALFLAAHAGASSDFEKEVAPILEAKCLSCHDAEQAKGDLVLVSLAEARAHGKAILPGDSKGSQLITEVSGESPNMPKKGAPLTAGEVEVLRQWIDAGASWPEERTLVDNPVRDLEWWSLKPIKSDSTGLGQASNPVDSYIDSKLREKKLNPVPQGEPADLVRRVTYDLTGLPPTPHEIDAYLKNPDWDALVGRLLASPAFGEKFAQHWLDLARYAETHGYDKDKPRENAWPFRDYVIRSFNQDKPYSRFLQEQVAGDVLFPEEPDGVVALGFLAAGPWDFIAHWEVGEGKLDGRIAKHLDRDEMISAVFNTFQATTIQCAQCHHHKFDPIRMEDYYRLHAVFAAVDRADRVYAGLPADKQKRKNEIEAKLSALKAEEEELAAAVKELIAGKASGIDRRLAELKAKYGTELQPQYGYHSGITKNQAEVKWVQIDLGQARDVSQVRVIPAYDDFGGIGGGFGFPIRYRVEVSDHADFAKEVRALLDVSGSDQPNPGTRMIAIDGDEELFRYLRLTATKLAERKDDFILAIGEIEVLSEAGAENYARKAVVTAADTIEQAVRWKKANLVDGIAFQELSNDEALAEFRELQDRRAVIEKANRNPETEARVAAIKAEMAVLSKELAAFPKGELVYAASTQFARGGRFTATGGKPRPIHLLHRGDLTTPGDVMRPGVPPLWNGAPDEFYSGGEWSEAEARAELARYLTDENNPLVWRTIANRLWQWTFGKPIVGTPNDFGRGGLEPIHPELLDFLAATLRDDPNQSMKSILRLLFTSEAYRRASTHDESNAAIDRGNAYLWRGHRRRLTAEELRDSVLSVSNVIDRKMGGPGFQDFVIEKPQHSPHYQYHLHDPNDPASFRRSVYRFVVRSQPQPMLTTFDCADPSMSVPQRDESTTALQALTQWNHQFVEAMAQHFAKTIDPQNSHESINDAFRRVTGSLPTDDELKILVTHLEREGPESLARILFNLNAFVYVD
ncbi:DUF1553 domain-containing protein [Verrucomicrobiales bacterium]|nr:DUF1553 domain-containing protein [Verrucomicrobiales bacterium]